MTIQRGRTNVLEIYINSLISGSLEANLSEKKRGKINNVRLKKRQRIVFIIVQSLVLVNAV